MKIYSLGAEFLYAEGRTDMTKLIVAFRSFANVPKNRDLETHWRQNLKHSDTLWLS